MRKENKNKILIIGSSNTDMTVKVDRLPVHGETILGGCFTMGQGGKGANQAVAAARLGGNADFVCVVGNDLFGKTAMQHYESEGISTNSCFVSNTAPTGVALISVDKKAENTIVVASGANSEMSVAHIEQIRSLIESSYILLLQLEIPIEAVYEAAKIAYDAGVRVILNPAPSTTLPEELYRYLSIIIPNETEASLMTGVKVDDVFSAEKAAEYLMAKGVDNVIITMGSKGSLLCMKEQKPIYTPSVKVAAVDTTAAGDTFCGALCVALTEGKSLVDAVKFATLASSMTVQKIGAQASMPMRSDIVEY